MKNKKIITLITLLSLTFPNIVYADVNDDVKNAQKLYQDYQDRVDVMTTAIMELNGVIERNLATVDENNSKVKRLDAQIEYSKVSIEELNKSIEAKEELKAERVRQFYKTGYSASYISIILDSGNLSEVISNVNSVNKIMELDRSIISGIAEDKKKLDEELSKQELAKTEIVTLNEEVKEKLKLIESKKVEQEKVLRTLELEQEVFGKEILEVAERNLIMSQRDTINGESGLEELKGAVSQLKSIRDNQIQTDVVKSEIDELISIANNKISSLTVINAPTISNANRGPFNSTGQDIVNYAYQFLGKEYVWGAVGPEVFDCSGLTSYVYRNAANLEISRTTYTQINVGTPVSQDELQPGDLVFTYDNEHVGIYVGGGNYINATYPGSTVRVTPVTNFYAARRYLN